jgi:hypothetical protein
MEEIIFHAEKKFSIKEKKDVNVDITFIEHNTNKKNQYIEIINTDINTKIECRIYILLSDDVIYICVFITCMCMYVCIYVYVYICICIYIHIYIYCIYIYICMHLFMYFFNIFVFIYMNTYMYI